MDRSLVSVLTATLKDAEEIVADPPFCRTVAVPVIWEVRPTASLSAGRNASFSRTRYPAFEPLPTLYFPAGDDAVPVTAVVLEAVVEVEAAVDVAPVPVPALASLNGAGEDVGKTTK
jgi:hypothetical protein